MTNTALTIFQALLIWKWKSLSRVQLFATPWSVQSLEFSQARILEWVAFPFSRDIPNPESNPGLPHCRRILYQPSHKGNPRILEWVAYPSSSGSSQPRNWTRVSCIAGRFFTNWAIREWLGKHSGNTDTRNHIVCEKCVTWPPRTDEKRTERLDDKWCIFSKRESSGQQALHPLHW